MAQRCNYLKDMLRSDSTPSEEWLVNHGPRAVPCPKSDTFSIIVQQTGEAFNCREAESVLQGMSRTGHRAIPVGCVNGGCGICKVQVLSGSFRSGAMSRAHISEDEEARGIVLACRVLPRSDLALRVIGKVGKFLNVWTQAP